MPESRIQIDQQALAAFCRENGIANLSLFGSVLRDDFGPESDVDMLIEFKSGVRVGYFDLAQMEIELSHVVGRKVDPRTVYEFHPSSRDRVVAASILQFAA